MIALATCEDFPALYEDDRLLLPELARREQDFEIVIWDDPKVDWQRYSTVIVRSTWDYYKKLPQFLAWTEKVERMGARLWNPAAVIRKNVDKLYLRELEKQGVPILPTSWIDPQKPLSLKKAIECLEGEEFILKPTVSANANETYRFHRKDVARHEADLARILERCTAMVQPFAPEFIREGEWSLVFFGTSFSHAILKTPKSGDFRVQFTFGGKTQPGLIREEWISQARKIVQSVSSPLLYARVDAIHRHGQLFLGELEITEPCLFLNYEPGAASRFADWITKTSFLRKP